LTVDDGFVRQLTNRPSPNLRRRDLMSQTGQTWNLLITERAHRLKKVVYYPLKTTSDLAAVQGNILHTKCHTIFLWQNGVKSLFEHVIFLKSNGPQVANTKGEKLRKNKKKIKFLVSCVCLSDLFQNFFELIARSLWIILLLLKFIVLNMEIECNSITWSYYNSHNLKHV